MKWPDARGWLLIGLFSLAFCELGMIAWNPALAENKLFFALAVATWNGGVLLAAAFYFGSSSSGAVKDNTIATMAANASGDPPNPS